MPTFQAVHKPQVSSSSISTTLTFTNCNATGKNGPSQSNCNSEYSGTSLDGDVTVSNGIQSWTIPSTGTYTIECFGAQGGGGGQTSSGYGAGGGGYSGGGGGMWTGSRHGNGGGGGSYNSSSTNTASTEGNREDHGQVIITY